VKKVASLLMVGFFIFTFVIVIGNKAPVYAEPFLIAEAEDSDSSEADSELWRSEMEDDESDSQKTEEEATEGETAEEEVTEQEEDYGTYGWEVEE
jgi:hypothetical protein